MRTIRVLVSLSLCSVLYSFVVPHHPSSVQSVQRQSLRTPVIPLHAQREDDEENIIVFTKDDGPIPISKLQTTLDFKRFFFFNAVALIIAFGANFMQITSFLMSNTQPEFFRAQRIDQLYSIGGFNRCYDVEDQYEFIYPDSWVKDRYIILADARDRELPMDIRNRRAQKLRPDTAFGPPKGDGKENLSVIKNSVLPGFSLAGTLGSPKEAAEKLLRESIAPPDSGKVATLIDAYSTERDGIPQYILEFTVQKGDEFFQHSLSAIAARGTELYTLTFVCPESRWNQLESTAKSVVSSFTFISKGSTPQGFY